MDCFESPHNCSWETVTRDLKGPAAKLKSYPECNMRLQCCLWPELLSRSRISQEISHDRAVSLFYGTRQDKMSSRVVTLEQKTPLCYGEAADVYSCACSALISWVICVRDNQKVENTPRCPSETSHTPNWCNLKDNWSNKERDIPI